MAEVDDYAVDEERVMRGADHRIAPAVESAVAMGFDAEQATEVAKREIIKFPGRGDVTEFVIDALLQAAPGGGDRAYPPLPPEMPAIVAKRWSGPPAAAAAALNVVEGAGAGATEGGAIDLTAPTPEHDDTRQKINQARDEKGKGVLVDRGKEVVTIDDDHDDDHVAVLSGGRGVAAGGDGGGGGCGGGNSLMAELARQRMARDKERGGGAPPTSAHAAVLKSTNKRYRALGFGGGGSGGGSSGGNLTGAAARAANLSSAPAGGDSVGSLGILDALLSGVAPIKEPLKEVRILTYNVWFAEHVALVDRVQGGGGGGGGWLVSSRALSFYHRAQ